MAAYRYKETWKKKQKEDQKEADGVEIDKRIEKVEEELEAVGRRYMALEQELQSLREKKKKTDVAAVAEAYMKSRRTAEEVIRFLQS
jgi:predicted  nucleic acid-binding Zn-ribbon protein